MYNIFNSPERSLNPEDYEFPLIISKDRDEEEGLYGDLEKQEEIENG